MAELLGTSFDNVEGAFESGVDNLDEITGLISLVENYAKVKKTVAQYEKKVEQKEEDMNAHAEWIEQMIAQKHMVAGDERWTNARARLAEMNAEYDNYHSLYIEKEEELERVKEALLVFLYSKGFDVSDASVHKSEAEARTVPIQSSSPPALTSLGETKAPKMDGEYLNDVNKIVSHIAEFIRSSCKGATFEAVNCPKIGEMPLVKDLVTHIFYMIGTLSEEEKIRARTTVQIAWNNMVLEQEFDSLHDWLMDYQILDVGELQELMDNYLVEQTEDGLRIHYTPSYMARSRRPTRQLKSTYGNGSYG